MNDVWTTAHLAALAWGGDPAFAFVPQPPDFSGRTVRQAVRLRRGGTALRLVLSNEYGEEPLVIDGLTVAGGADPRSVRQDGRDRWEIPAGATATSDPVRLPTAAGDEIVVSAFLAGGVPSATYLHSAQRTGSYAPGNQLGRPELSGAEEFPSLYWISQVLVDSPAHGPVVVAFGDSVTRGDTTTPDRDQRYPDHLQRRLLAAGAGHAVVLNAGVGGNRLLGTGLGPSMSERFERDVLGVAEATHVIIMGGLNDLGMGFVLGTGAPSAEVIADGLLALAARAHRHGIQPVLGTVTPFGGSVYESFRAAGNEAVRQGVNHLLIAQGKWPVADFAAAVALPGDPTRLAPAFDSGDGVHPGDLGARALAEAVDLAYLTSQPDRTSPGSLASAAATASPTSPASLTRLAAPLTSADSPTSPKTAAL